MPAPAEESIPFAAQRLRVEAGEGSGNECEVPSSAKEGVWASHADADGGVAPEDTESATQETKVKNGSNDDGRGVFASPRAAVEATSSAASATSSVSNAASIYLEFPTSVAGTLSDSSSDAMVTEIVNAPNSSAEAQEGAWASGCSSSAPISVPTSSSLTTEAATPALATVISTLPTPAATFPDGVVTPSIFDITAVREGLLQTGTCAIGYAPASVVHGARVEPLVIPPAPATADPASGEPHPAVAECSAGGACIAACPSALLPMSHSLAAPTLRTVYPVVGLDFSLDTAAASAAGGNTTDLSYADETAVQSLLLTGRTSIPGALALQLPSPAPVALEGEVAGASMRRARASIEVPSLSGIDAESVSASAVIGTGSKRRSTRKKRADDTGGAIPRRNRTRPTCATEACTRRPLFGMEGTRRGKYCARHKETGMVNVFCRRCEIDDCKRQPSFGMLGSRPMRCAAHRLEGMVNVLSPRCVSPECQVWPSFGRPGEKKPSVCAAHRREGDVDLVSRRCRNEACVRRPVFGDARVGKAYYCASHKLEGMINIFTTRCAIPKCLRPPTWGLHDSKKPTHCAKHREPLYENKF